MNVRVTHLVFNGLAGVSVCGRSAVRRMVTHDKPWRVTCKQCRARMPMKLRTMVAPMVERTNLLTGVKYTEPEDTPGFMSPSSEAYWSM
jgi:hypothetical protein